MAILLRHDNPADTVHSGGRNLNVGSGKLISRMHVEFFSAAALDGVAIVDGKDRSRRGEDDVCAIGQTGKTKLAAVVGLREAGEARLLRAGRALRSGRAWRQDKGL